MANIVGKSVPSGQLGAHPVEAELVVVGEVDQVQGQSPYGKHKCGNLYTSQKQYKKHGGVLAAQGVETDSDVGGAPPGKVGDESPLGSSANANVEPIVRPVADEGFPMGQLRVDDVDGSVHIRMVSVLTVVELGDGNGEHLEIKIRTTCSHVAEEGAAEDTKGTIGRDGGRKLPCDVVVDAGVVVTDEKSGEGVAKDGPEVPTQSEKGATYDGPMVVGVDAVRYDTHGTEVETSVGPSTQTSVVVEGTVDEGRDGSGNPSPIAMVVMTLDEDSSPASSETGRGSQPPQQHPQCASEVGGNSKFDGGKVTTLYEDSGVSPSEAALGIVSPAKNATEE
ncbi:hypothetical protein Cgig2_025242 [Carnegiea gigantea]|uniref:Uncharacterized protein n=1 Tax=Carnegiea gigantea TaxID=171969 RepID=A0A9Q1GWQ1_9CARY|nr:hypothetical protein Cgig2_025242 [Carnegiea gigantea]